MNDRPDGARAVRRPVRRRRRALAAGAAAVATLAAVLGVLALRGDGVPSPAEVRAAYRPSDVAVLDRNGAGC